MIIDDSVMVVVAIRCDGEDCSAEFSMDALYPTSHRIAQMRAHAVGWLATDHRDACPDCLAGRTRPQGSEAGE